MRSLEDTKIPASTGCVFARRSSALLFFQGSSGAIDYDEGGDIAGLGSNRDMLALKRQMEELGLQVQVLLKLESFR